MAKNKILKPKELFVVGLGNPGEDYDGTRHNTGRIVVASVAKALGAPDFEPDKKSCALLSLAKIGRLKTHFILPETFMNKSGEAVVKFVKSKKDALGLIVVHDDLDLPIGRAKMSFARHSGGHKGVESIIKKIKTEEFTRIRIGISPANPSGKIKKPQGGEAVEKLILGKFSAREMDILKKESKVVTEALSAFAENGKDVATGIVNSAL